jgi:hypothetical protein
MFECKPFSEYLLFPIARMHKRQKLLYERQRADYSEMSKIIHLTCYII